MPSVILGLALLAFWLYCLFDVITSPEQEVRRLPKVLWVVIVVLLAALGGLLWVLLGRPRQGDSVAGMYGGYGMAEHLSPAPEAEAPRGPDDDPEFLRSLDRRLRDED
ncbi:PLDc N-terminal domain-containing protein [Planotetraspora thailandica]|nr:PLDc N-terminal domain-containing protein [Planotetraspora thailandica]